MDQARFHGSKNTGFVLRVKSGDRYLNAKRSEARRLDRFLRGHYDFEPLGTERPGFQVFCGIEPGAGPQRNQEKLGRSHAVIRTAIISRLIANDPVAARSRRELHIPEMLNGNLHIVLPEKMQLRAEGDSGRPVSNYIQGFWVPLLVVSIKKTDTPDSKFSYNKPGAKSARSSPGLRMRHVKVCACLLIAAATPAFAITPISDADVTVIVNFKGTYSAPAIKEMQREAGAIIQSSGIRLDWRLRSEAADLTFNDLVVITFKGTCVYNPVPLVVDELGPYAFTRTTDGEVQPFGEVDCDHVVSSLHSAMSGSDFAKADVLLGRALGRVVAHELVHMLTKSKQHAKAGIEKASLSARQLISESLPLSQLDVDRLQQERHH